MSRLWENLILVTQVCSTTQSLNMKVSSMLVISVTMKLHSGVIWQLIFNLYMKVSSMLVISATIKLQHRVVWQDIFNHYMMVSSMLVVSVIIKVPLMAFIGIWKLNICKYKMLNDCFVWTDKIGILNYIVGPCSSGYPPGLVWTPLCPRCTPTSRSPSRSTWAGADSSCRPGTSPPPGRARWLHIRAANATSRTFLTIHSDRRAGPHSPGAPWDVQREESAAGGRGQPGAALQHGLPQPQRRVWTRAANEPSRIFTLPREGPYHG